MRDIAITDLTKSFGSVTALDQFELTIGAGESVALLGPSGSGKTTILRIIAGLEEADEGTILFDGVDQRTVPAHERDVAIVFQNFALYPNLSAADNIAAGLIHGLGLARSEAKHRVTEVARMLDIIELLDRRPSAMSGGQRQRVALGRALARRSSTVLLDEPLSGLDAQLKAELRVEIRDLLRRSSSTAVHVTHDQADALAMADQLVVLLNGRVQQVSSPAVAYETPANTFVAGFLGTPAMNLIEAVRAGPDYPLPGRCRVSVRGTQEDSVTFGVRPEHLRIGEDTSPFRLEGEVISDQLAGPDWVVHLRTGHHTVALRHSYRPPPPGTPVTVSARSDQVHIFSTGTGRRLDAVVGDPA